MRQQSNRLWLMMLTVAGFRLLAEAALLTPSVKAYSTQLGSREAVNSCNGSGLTGSGNLGDPHTNVENNNMWTTRGNTSAPADYDPYITYDLGAFYDVTVIREWGYNYSSPFGPSNVVVYTSQDGITFTNAGSVIFAKAPGAAGYGGHDIGVNYPAVRYIKLDIMTSWDGAVFDGTGTQGGRDTRSLTGLSEIRFEGTKYGGTLITPMVNAFSTELTSAGRQAFHSCDGTGLTGIGNQGDPHNTEENNVAWTTIGTNVVTGSVDFDPYITYDLGGLYNVKLIREWGYNTGLQVGPSNVVVYTSQDGNTFTEAGTVTFAKAPSNASYGGNEIAVNYPAVRFIKLDIMTSWNGAVFDGTGAQRGADGRALTGLSEIRFVGTRLSPWVFTGGIYDGFSNLVLVEAIIPPYKKGTMIRFL